MLDNLYPQFTIHNLQSPIPNPQFKIPNPSYTPFLSSKHDAHFVELRATRISANTNIQVPDALLRTCECTYIQITYMYMYMYITICICIHRLFSVSLRTHTTAQVCMQVCTYVLCVCISRDFSIYLEIPNSQIGAKATAVCKSQKRRPCQIEETSCCLLITKGYLASLSAHTRTYICM